MELCLSSSVLVHRADVDPAKFKTKTCLSVIVCKQMCCCMFVCVEIVTLTPDTTDVDTDCDDDTVIISISLDHTDDKTVEYRFDMFI